MKLALTILIKLMTTLAFVHTKMVCEVCTNSLPPQIMTVLEIFLYFKISINSSQTDISVRTKVTISVMAK